MSVSTCGERERGVTATCRSKGAQGSAIMETNNNIEKDMQKMNLIYVASKCYTGTLDVQQEST